MVLDDNLGDIGSAAHDESGWTRVHRTNRKPVKKWQRNASYYRARESNGRGTYNEQTTTRQLDHDLWNSPSISETGSIVSSSYSSILSEENDPFVSTERVYWSYPSSLSECYCELGRWRCSCCTTPAYSFDGSIWTMDPDSIRIFYIEEIDVATDLAAQSHMNDAGRWITHPFGDLRSVARARNRKWKIRENKGGCNSYRCRKQGQTEQRAKNKREKRENVKWAVRECNDTPCLTSGCWCKDFDEKGSWTIPVPEKGQRCSLVEWVGKEGRKLMLEEAYQQVDNDALNMIMEACEIDTDDVWELLSTRSSETWSVVDASGDMVDL
ncbi:hypothetical protein P153DRAFT_431886 [Dothidotthia symphoricarpi CBS 119687]|uniref:Uncharacterized protein n=1 Tax=Dothidotthia symphoricarpi CBS 119687 TaxID=1392245 RepID=A0A6A6AB86_9PLEO|nr:uncharacterized protein P153DRAFT_431886 [Dothidotthia symphoricarpi CBS 119687]KAF2129090.1 hypothetical protein P153DRAFT_431886 [Dothidotthia symphoricarpi CBS 119687]